MLPGASLSGSVEHGSTVSASGSFQNISFRVGRNQPAQAARPSQGPDHRAGPYQAG